MCHTWVTAAWPVTAPVQRDIGCRSITVWRRHSLRRTVRIGALPRHMLSRRRTAAAPRPRPPPRAARSRAPGCPPERRRPGTRTGPAPRRRAAAPSRPARAAASASPRVSALIGLLGDPGRLLRRRPVAHRHCGHVRYPRSHRIRAMPPAGPCVHRWVVSPTGDAQGGGGSSVSDLLLLTGALEPAAEILPSLGLLLHTVRVGAGRGARAGRRAARRCRAGRRPA